MATRSVVLAVRPIGAVVLCLLAFVAVERTAAAATVPLRATVIAASNQGAGIDEKLGTLVKQLNEAFKYSKYDLVGNHGGDAQVGQAWKASLPGNRTLEVTPTAVADGQYKLQVRVLGPTGEPVMTSNVNLRPGGTVLIGGPPHPPGVLIIALSAS